MGRQNKKKEEERTELNYETDRNKDRHAVRGGERERERDSSGQICSNRETEKTNTAPFCLPHQKAFSSKCQGSWISGPPVLLSQARLPSWFDSLSLNLEGQVSSATRACTAGLLWLIFEMQPQLQGKDIL